MDGKDVPLIPQKECRAVHPAGMRTSLDKMLARFLRQQRGATPYAVFAKKLGITPSSLFRLENGQQSATLKTFQQICERLKVKPQAVFSEM